MALLRGGKLRSFGDGSGKLYGYMFWCPGCNGAHAVYTANSQITWTFDGNVERPTFSPSLLLTWNEAPHLRVDVGAKRCHSFIRDGQIQFLGDCTHALRGQTVPLPSWPADHLQWSDGHDGTGA